MLLFLLCHALRFLINLGNSFLSYFWLMVDGKILPVKKKSEVHYGNDERKQYSIVWRRSYFGKLEWGTGSASATHTQLHGSVKSLCFGKIGEAQVLQEDRVFGGYGSQEDE